jgi:hypothetical protein
MPGASIDQDGLTPPLAADQLLVCGHCGREWTPADLEGFAEGAVGLNHGYPWHAEDGRPYCESCDGYGAFKVVSTQPGIDARWPKAALLKGFAPDPILLVRHFSEMGISNTGKQILDQHETYRVRAGQGVYVGADVVAGRLGLSVDHTRRELSILVKAGFLERRTRRNWDGTKKSPAYTRLGLNRVLALVGANVAQGVDPVAGVPELLASICDSHRAPMPVPPGTDAADHRAPVPTEVEGRQEVEGVVEPDLDYVKRGLTPGAAGGGVDELPPLTTVTADDQGLQVAL